MLILILGRRVALVLVLRLIMALLGLLLASPALRNTVSWRSVLMRGRGSAIGDGLDIRASLKSLVEVADVAGDVLESRNGKGNDGLKRVRINEMIIKATY